MPSALICSNFGGNIGFHPQDYVKTGESGKDKRISKRGQHMCHGILWRISSSLMRRFLLHSM